MAGGRSAAFRVRFQAPPPQDCRNNHGRGSAAPRPARPENTRRLTDGRSSMPKYVLLLGGTDVDKRGGNAALAAKVYEHFASWLSSVRENGKVIASHKLRDQTGARLSVRGGQVVEGPFMETKEAVGGVVFLEADSLEQAVEIARGCPIHDLQNG